MHRDRQRGALVGHHLHAGVTLLEQGRQQHEVIVLHPHHVSFPILVKHHLQAGELGFSMGRQRRLGGAATPCSKGRSAPDSLLLVPEPPTMQQAWINATAG